MQKAKSRRSHVLLTLGVLFTIGGTARLLPGALAKAEGNAASVEETVVEPEAKEDEHSDEAHAPAPSDSPEAAEAKGPPTALTKLPEAEVCITGETARQISKDRALVDAEMASLREKEIALKDWEARLRAETSDLQELQQALDAKWEEMQAGSSADIKHLAQMYGAMKPDQAAQIFNKMDPSFAAGFLRRLTSAQAGLILAAMDTEKAYVVSVKLASMNNDVRIAAKN